MKAAVLSTPNEPMSLEDIRIADPKEHEVLLKVAACGVCHTDLHVIKGEVKFPTPAVLGHEVSGTVEAVGPGVVNVKPGDRVACSFIMPCGSCELCTQGREDLCSTFFSHNRLNGHLYDGTSRLSRPDGSPVAMYSMGGLAEYAVTPDTSVFKLPDGLPLAESAIIGCSIFTAYGAVRHQADLRPGQSIAVFAIGGVGTQVLQMAKAFGAGEIIAVDVRADKLEMAQAMGATHVIDSSAQDPVAKIMEITGGRGVGVAVEALGLPVTVQQAFNSV
ncbi:MAG: alcohol dehydrogenase catalytic domain-containing protein, partial [Dehalococcoidia bacterium]